MRTVRVDLGPRGYDVVVGYGASAELASFLPPGARRAAVVTQATIPAELDLGIEHRSFEVGVGEEAKTLATVEQLCREFAAWGLTRSDVVIGLGGGMVTDVAGFAAAVYHRGVPVVHVATTLLAMVDAAIGGKTGVNLPEGKNLVGAFWQPAAVICDTALLGTLPPREWRSGTGEVAKYHFLGEPHLDAMDLDERVARCVELKARVVEADERESRLRATLNYGHTLAHALEIATGYELAHGEAVAVGLIYAARLAERLGRIDAGRVREHERVVAAYDLPSTVPPGIAAGELVEIMGRDKKRSSDLLTFVLDGDRGVEVVDDVDPVVVREVLVEMGAS